MSIVGTEVRIIGTSWTGVIKNITDTEDGPWADVKVKEEYVGKISVDLDGLETLDGENIFQIWAS